jgi:hypothetical protein
MSAQPHIVECREQRSGRLRACSKPRTTRRDRLAFHQRLEQFLSLAAELACRSRVARSPAVYRNGTRDHADRERRAGILSLEFAELPLAALARSSLPFLALPGRNKRSR